MWVSSICMNIGNAVLNELSHSTPNWNGSGICINQHYMSGFIWKVGFAVLFFMSYFSVSPRSVPIQLKDISVLGFCFKLYLLLGLSVLSVAAQIFLSFQGARLGEICCFTSVRNSSCRRDKSGTVAF